MKTIPIQHIREMAEHRPEGYFVEVIGRGVIKGDILEIEDTDYQELCRKYRPVMPTVSEMVSNFKNAVSKWVTAGFPVVSNDTFTDRLESCVKCDFWDHKSHRCAKCGCTRLKLWLETEQCPIDRWH